MSRLADAKKHKIFQVERRGRALLVTPRGDAPGFGHADFKVERERVMALLQGGREHLIVDFGGANYFGSEMIGVVNRMVAAVRERGGTVAVVNVSGDMREGLAIMKLDERWNLMDERRALKEVARENALSVLRRNAKALLLTLAVLVLVGGAATAYLLVDRRQDTRDYVTILVVWENLQLKRKKPLYEIELASWKETQRENLQPLIDRLEKTATMHEKGRQFMLTATRDHLVRMLDPYMKRTDPRTELHFLNDMELARKQIEKKERVKLSKLSRPDEEYVVPPTVVADEGAHDGGPPTAPHPDAPPDPDPVDPLRVDHGAPPSEHGAPPSIDTTPGASGTPADESPKPSDAPTTDDDSTPSKPAQPDPAQSEPNQPEPNQPEPGEAEPVGDEPTPSDSSAKPSRMPD